MTTVQPGAGAGCSCHTPVLVRRLPVAPCRTSRSSAGVLASDTCARYCPGVVDEDVLRTVSFFDDLHPDVVATLAECAEDVRLDAGSLIIEQGDDATHVLLLLEGSIEALLHYEGVGELFMGTHEQPGTLIGWSAFQPPRRYSDSIRCHRPSRLLRVPAAAFEEVVAGDPAVGYELLRRVNAQVAQQLETTRQFVDAARDEIQEL